MSHRCLVLLLLIPNIGCSKEKLPSSTTSSSSQVVPSAKKAGPSGGPRPVASWTKTDAGNCRYGPEHLALPPADGYCDQSKCKAASGKCVWGGFGCNTVCALRTTDEGIDCENNSECQGLCETDPKIPTGTKTKGKCNDVMVGMGCHNVVDKGVTTGHLCAD